MWLPLLLSPISCLFTVQVGCLVRAWSIGLVFFFFPNCVSLESVLILPSSQQEGTARPTGLNASVPGPELLIRSFMRKPGGFFLLP